jgi:magnesium transporter
MQTDLHHDLSELKSLLGSNDVDGLREFCDTGHPGANAEVIAQLEVPEIVEVLSRIDLHTRTEIFAHMEIETQMEVASTLRRRDLVALVSTMSHDDRVDLFKRFPEEMRETILPGLAQAERDDILKLSSHPEGTAGSIMTSDYVTLSPDLTARQAIEKLRQEAPDKETIYHAYVIDEHRRLLGVVSLRELILAPGGRKVQELMNSELIFARVEDDQQDVARLISRYDLLALPIINGGDKLVGIVTHDDAMDVAEQEATEDFHKSATVGTLPSSIKEVGLTLLFRKRVFWLVLLVFGSLFSGAGIAYYEDTIAQYVALVFFLPLLINSAGNAGSQSATLMIRALATGDVVPRDWTHMLGRELLVATALGLTMALAVSALGLMRGGFGLAIVVALTMILVVVAGSVIGMSLPFLLSRLQMDPATASAPLITTISDALGVVIYFAIATSLLSMM